MMRPTILLWDIDGTLIDGGGSGRLAMEEAFAEVVGDASALPRVRFSGMTDPGIVRAGLRVLERDPTGDAALIEAVLTAYLERLPAAIGNATGFRVHRGVRERLAALAQRDELAIGLGTGNLERGARLKLEPLALADAFAFGGYGSDHEDRAELIAIGARRGAQLLGCDRQHARVIVIGDTPKDIAAAHAIGAECLAVATGFFDVEQLRAAGADVAVADLDDAAAALVFGLR
jgi:phosphoglycolate phosphatase